MMRAGQVPGPNDSSARALKAKWMSAFKSTGVLITKGDRRVRTVTHAAARPMPEPERVKLIQQVPPRPSDRPALWILLGMQ